jgi:hypothetical protein
VDYRNHPMIRPGVILAFGLMDGRCPVGVVLRTNKTRIEIGLLFGSFGEFASDPPYLIRWDEIGDITWAYRTEDPMQRAMEIYGRKVYDTEPLIAFQKQWVEEKGCNRFF